MDKNNTAAATAQTANRTADLIIIGAGPGGYEAAAHAARNGLTVTIIEEREVGGTCLNRGCIPTKSLVHSAEVLRMSSNSFQTYGVGVDHKDDVVQQLRSGVETILSQPGITLVKGRAELLKDENSEGRHAVLVKPSGLIFTAPNIIIATGSQPKMPPIEGIDDKTVVSSDQLLDMRELPKSLCIVGAGVIGMEFASIFATWGVEVTVVEFLKECLPVLDSDIAKRLRKALEKRGVNFIMQAAVKSIHDGTVTYERKGKESTTAANVVLVATGRAPLTSGLGLEAAGVEFTPKGITVNERMQTNVAGIYAIGDVNGRMMLAHAATFQGYRAVNAILNKTDKIQLDIMPSAVFTYPEAASVGLSEEQAKEKGVEVKVGKAFHRSNGKALTMNETEGMVKLIVNATDGTIIGLHAYGEHAADMAQEAAALMNLGATAEDLQATVHIHPTLGELLHAAAMTL